MSNIHTLSEFRSPSYGTIPAPPPPPPPTPSASSPNSSAARLLDILFPHCSFRSVLLYISLLQAAVYIATLIVGSELPLVPSAKTLYYFQANYPPAIKAGQLGRLFCPIFLHANFFHIFFNIFFQLRMGFAIEQRYGLVRFTLLYFLTGICGNLFSAVIFFCNSLKVGASTSGFGLIGVLLAELALAWHLVQHRDRALLNIAIFVVTTSLFAFSINGGRIDHMGHIGGLLAGMCLAVFYNGEMENKPKWFEAARIASAGLLTALVVICTSVLFAVNRGCRNEMAR